MRLPEDPEESLQVNILPMIDVIFAILAFFIVATLFLTKAESLPVNLPKAVTSETQERAKVTVNVDEEGLISISEQPIELENLQVIVQALVEDEPAGAVVVINADEAVNHGRVVGIMDELRTVEGAVLGIATEKPTEGN